MSDDAPLVAGPLYGLREWSVRQADGGDRLAGPFAATEWPAEGLAARCTHGGHAAPAGDCSCGVYGWHPTRHSAATVLTGARDSVGGIVSVWGAVEVHGAGFRAAHGRPHTLVLPPGIGAKRKRRLRRLAEAYGADVLVGGPDALLAHCAAHGLGLDERAVEDLLGPAERLRRRRRAREAAACIAGAALGLVALVAGAVAAWPAVADWWEGEPAPKSAGPAIPAEVRSLHITGEYVVEGDDETSAYLAVVRNDHPTKAALGVFAAGTLRGRDGQTLARMDDRLAFDFRAMIGPGDSAVIVDELVEVEPITGRVRSYRTRPLARTFRAGVSPIRIAGVRLDRPRCIVEATVTSDRARLAAGVAVLANRTRRRLSWAQFVDVGPLREGRSRQVVMRVPPRECRRRVTAVAVYPDLRYGDVVGAR